MKLLVDFIHEKCGQVALYPNVSESDYLISNSDKVSFLYKIFLYRKMDKYQDVLSVFNKAGIFSYKEIAEIMLQVYRRFHLNRPIFLGELMREAKEYLNKRLKDSCVYLDNVPVYYSATANLPNLPMSYYYSSSSTTASSTSYSGSSSSSTYEDL